MARTKYDSYVVPLTFTDDGPGSFRQGTRIGSEALGLDVCIEYGTYWAAGMMGKEAERHIITRPTGWSAPAGSLTAR